MYYKRLDPKEGVPVQFAATYITRWPFEYGEPTALFVEADDPLLDAASDLLEACKAFVEAWEKSLQLEKTDVALKKARAAIAKAKGE